MGWWVGGWVGEWGVPIGGLAPLKSLEQVGVVRGGGGAGPVGVVVALNC